MNDDTDDLFKEIERRALFDMADDDDVDDVAQSPLIDSLREPGEAPVSRDISLGGYIEEHSRVPAFEGTDGQPYTVDIDVVQDSGDGFSAKYVAFLIFIRWAATGAGIMDHVESGDVGQGDTEEDARKAALDLSLYEVKAELDAAIERRELALED